MLECEMRSSLESSISKVLIKFYFPVNSVMVSWFITLTPLKSCVCQSGYSSAGNNLQVYIYSRGGAPNWND